VLQDRDSPSLKLAVLAMRSNPTIPRAFTLAGRTRTTAVMNHPAMLGTLESRHFQRSSCGGDDLGGPGAFGGIDTPGPGPDMSAEMMQMIVPDSVIPNKPNGTGPYKKVISHFGTAGAAASMGQTWATMSSAYSRRTTQSLTNEANSQVLLPKHYHHATNHITEAFSTGDRRRTSVD
jgi:hypothetical protein